MAFPYVAIKIDLGPYGSLKEGVSGYRIMELFDANFGGVMSALFQVLILVVGIAMLVWGVLGLLKGFGVLNKFPDKLGKVDCKKIAEILLYVFAILVFLIVYVASNNVDLGAVYADEMKLVVSAGVFISLVFSVGSLIAYKLIKKNAN